MPWESFETPAWPKQSSLELNGRHAGRFCKAQPYLDEAERVFNQAERSQRAEEAAETLGHYKACL